MFFYDASYGFSGGGIGDALGYTNFSGDCGFQMHGETTTYNGLQGALLGVGFDVKGGFGTINNNKTGTYNLYSDGNVNAGYTDLSANSITTRLGNISSYAVINTTPNLSTFEAPVTLHQHISSTDDVIFKSVRVWLQNETKQLKVQVKNPTTNKYVTYQTIDLDNLDTHGSYSDSLPDKIKIGMGFATSKAVTNCEIKNFAVYGDTVDSTVDTTKHTSLVFAESGTIIPLSGRGLEA